MCRGRGARLEPRSSYQQKGCLHTKTGKWRILNPCVVGRIPRWQDSKIPTRGVHGLHNAPAPERGGTVDRRGYHLPPPLIRLCSLRLKGDSPTGFAEGSYHIVAGRGART